MTKPVFTAEDFASEPHYTIEAQHAAAEANDRISPLMAALNVATEALHSSTCRCERINWQSPEYIICRRCRALTEIDRIAGAACRE